MHELLPWATQLGLTNKAAPAPKKRGPYKKKGQENSNWPTTEETMNVMDVDGADTGPVKQRGRHAWNKGKIIGQKPPL